MRTCGPPCGVSSGLGAQGLRASFPGPKVCFSLFPGVQKIVSGCGHFEASVGELKGERSGGNMYTWPQGGLLGPDTPKKGRREGLEFFVEVLGSHGAHFFKLDWNWTSMVHSGCGHFEASVGELKGERSGGHVQSVCFPRTFDPRLPRLKGAC